MQVIRHKQESELRKFLSESDKCKSGVKKMQWFQTNSTHKTKNKTYTSPTEKRQGRSFVPISKFRDNIVGGSYTLQYREYSSENFCQKSLKFLWNEIPSHQNLNERKVYLVSNSFTHWIASSELEFISLMYPMIPLNKITHSLISMRRWWQTFKFSNNINMQDFRIKLMLIAAKLCI